jgi:hypothetical protein
LDQLESQIMAIQNLSAIQSAGGMGGANTRGG